MTASLPLKRPLMPLCAPTRGHAAPSGRGEPIAARSMSAVPAVTVARVVLSPGYQPPAPWRSWAPSSETLGRRW